MAEHRGEARRAHQVSYFWFSYEENGRDGGINAATY